MNKHMRNIEKTKNNSKPQIEHLNKDQDKDKAMHIKKHNDKTKTTSSTKQQTHRSINEPIHKLINAFNN